MRVLNCIETGQVFGGDANEKHPGTYNPPDGYDWYYDNGFYGSGSGSGSNPMSDGSGSATDEAVQSFRDGNVFTGIGQIIGGAPEILGNGIDGIIRGVGDMLTPPTAEESGLRPAFPE